MSTFPIMLISGAAVVLVVIAVLVWLVIRANDKR